MTNGGGVKKNQPVEPAGQKQERKGLVDYLADSIDIIASDSKSLESIASHLALMDQTLQGIAGDIAQINARQLTAFDFIRVSAGRIEVTDINDIETPFECPPESEKAVTSSDVDQVTKEKY